MASRWLRASLAAAAAVSASPLWPRLMVNSTDTTIPTMPINTTTAAAAAAAAATTIINSNDTIGVSEAPPGYGGFRTVWAETFGGSAGQMVNEGNWEIITNTHVNNEWQQYTRSNKNMQISGGGTLQIVPLLDHATGQWTSGRVESKYVFTPADGKLTIAEAKIRFGDAPAANRQGIWPAFWILGDSIRHGTPWPACGEIDIMERVNGPLTGYGTIHCDVYPGGACNEPSGRGASTGIPDGGWHAWRVQWDRRPGDWASESLTWFRDGQQFHRVAGGELGQRVWNTLAAAPLHFILNLAVGGDWPGPPNSQTWDSFGNMLEIAYVAHYESQ